MTDTEILKRYINKFGKQIPDFNNEDYWDGLHKGMEWMNTHLKSEETKEYAYSYYHAIFLIKCIEEILQKGEDNERS